MAFYGSLFRPSGSKDGAGTEIVVPDYKERDIDADLEASLLADMFNAVVNTTATNVGLATSGAGAGLAKSGAGARPLGQMLQVVSNAPYFGNQLQKVVIWFLKQVHRYFTDSTLRNLARRSLTDRLTEDTKVIVAHSLGTVIAYEALCAGYGRSVRTLITLGSPLGVPALLSRFEPPTVPGNVSVPGTIERWFNIADGADIIALKKELRPIYGDKVTDYCINNGATMHDIRPYLTAKETGYAIITGL